MNYYSSTHPAKSLVVVVTNMMATTALIPTHVVCEEDFDRVTATDGRTDGRHARTVVRRTVRRTDGRTDRRTYST